MKISIEFDVYRKVWIYTVNDNPGRRKQKKMNLLFGEDVKLLVNKFIDEIENVRDDDFKKSMDQVSPRP